ncbi:hypothetical protein IAT40_001594 [Kwoniella sp. CBS 6097]
MVRSTPDDGDVGKLCHVIMNVNDVYPSGNGAYQLCGETSTTNNPNELICWGHLLLLHNGPVTVQAMKPNGYTIEVD